MSEKRKRPPRPLSPLCHRTDYGPAATGRIRVPVDPDVPADAYPTVHVIGSGYSTAVREVRAADGARQLDIDVAGDAHRVIVHWHRGL